MKKCIKCTKEQTIDNFYKHKQMSDGHINKCKNCCIKESKIHKLECIKDDNWLKNERLRNREKYYRLNYKDSQKPTNKKAKLYKDNYRVKYPEKYLAKMATQRLEKKEGYQLHHWSYLEEHYKDIISLSIKDHAIAHRYLIYDQERCQYRSLEGVLLDSKESHNQYIDLCIFNENI